MKIIDLPVEIPIGRYTLEKKEALSKQLKTMFRKH